MIAAIRGLCKMMIRGDYLEEDVNGAYERLKELEDKDEECAHLASLLEEGTLTDDDIVPCNEFEDDEARRKKARRKKARRKKARRKKARRKKARRKKARRLMGMNA